MPEPLIRIVDLRKNFQVGGAPLPVLRGITLDVFPGEFVAIMGPSGSGKSTLMNLLGLLDQPSSGRYVLAGQDVESLDHDARARLRSRSVGFVFQTFNLLGRSTAFENVELPLIYGGTPQPERHRRCMAALDTVALGHRRDHSQGQLSGGEQQRVAIARASCQRSVAHSRRRADGRARHCDQRGDHGPFPRAERRRANHHPGDA